MFCNLTRNSLLQVVQHRPSVGVGAAETDRGTTGTSVALSIERWLQSTCTILGGGSIWSLPGPGASCRPRTTPGGPVQTAMPGWPACIYPGYLSEGMWATLPIRVGQEALSQTMPSLQPLAQLQHAIQVEQQLGKGAAATALEGKAGGKGKSAEGLGARGTDISGSF